MNMKWSKVGHIALSYSTFNHCIMIHTDSSSFFFISPRPLKIVINFIMSS